MYIHIRSEYEPSHKHCTHPHLTVWRVSRNGATCLSDSEIPNVIWCHRIYMVKGLMTLFCVFEACYWSSDKKDMKGPLIVTVLVLFLQIFLFVKITVMCSAVAQTDKWEYLNSSFPHFKFCVFGQSVLAMYQIQVFWDVLGGFLMWRTVVPSSSGSHTDRQSNFSEHCMPKNGSV